MNKSSLMLHLTDLLEKANLTSCDPAHVCYFMKTIQCQKSNHTNIEHPVFMNLTRIQREKGLSGPEWDRLASTILFHLETILKEKK